MEVIPIPIASAAHLVTAFEAEAKKEKLAFEKLQEPVSGKSIHICRNVMYTVRMRSSLSARNQRRPTLLTAANVAERPARPVLLYRGPRLCAGLCM